MQVLNVHFGWTDEFEQFESQFDNALKCMNQEQLSIIGGDFNISSNSKEYRYIKEKGLQDLFDIEGFQEEPTFFGVHGECPEERRIDYIMSNKKIHVLKRELLFKTDPVSDHAALFISVVTD
jgi:endonuclease/exonuclease/phosphatase family metal-dependent hydrolase